MNGLSEEVGQYMSEQRCVSCAVSCHVTHHLHPTRWFTTGWSSFTTAHAALAGMHPSAQTGVSQGDSFVNHGSFQNVIHGETQRRRSTLSHEENFFRRLQCMRLCIMAALRRYAHKSLRIYMLLFRLHPPPAIILPCTFVNPAGSHKKTCCIQSHTCWCYRGAQYGWHPRNSMQYLPRGEIIRSCRFCSRDSSCTSPVAL